jgi:cytochrome c-type biogenesis protein CcsB
MKRLLVVLVLLLSAASVRAADTFADKLDLTPLETISLQHRQTIKTFDSFARQMLTSITGRGSLDGKPAIYTIIDMAVNPSAYVDRNIIKIKNVPLRQDLQRLEIISTEEKQRIIKDGTVSLRFMFKPEVAQLMEELESQAVFKASAVGQARAAAGTMAAICRGFSNFPPAALIAPATGSPDDHKWKRLDEIAGNVQAYAESMKQSGQPAPAALPNYDSAKLERLAQTVALLVDGWSKQNADAVNTQAKALAEQLPAVAPAQYPSELKRRVEVVYNRMMKLTLPASALYFFAFVCFLMSSRSGVGSLRLWGLRLFAVGLIVHTLGIGIRWWLVAGQHGNWFDGIPIKNQFESVMFSAWFGAVVGFILELWRRSNGIFGAAASFVGWLSLTAIFATPYVTGTDIGGEIGQVQGVLMSYWLYIHVTMVTASYALIGMAFLLSIRWLITYYRAYGTVRRLPSRQISSDADVDVLPSGVSSGGAIALSPWQTLARIFFFPVGGTGLQPVSSGKRHGLKTHATEGLASSLLARLDACNLVVLQLAFWILGTGVILGAIWADQSWGRPWGWDPKETFALVTWIVYLIVVHVRVATENKAWWTAVLSIIGFFVMLFNWVGVNFFLVGLHSYA